MGKSEKERKIEFAEFTFHGKKDEEGNETNRKSLFIEEIIEHIDLLSVKDRQYDIGPKTHKLSSYKVNKNKYIEITFVSFKTGYTPPISNKQTGSERPTDKNMNEGDNDYTHILIDADSDDYRITILKETNVQGLTLKALKEYLEYFGKIILHRKDAEDKYFNIQVEFIVSDDIEDILENSTRISELVLTSQKDAIKDDWESFADLNDFEEIKDTIDIVIKPEYKKSIPIVSSIKWVKLKNKKFQRVRIRGFDDHTEPFFYDSNIYKKFKYVKVKCEKTNGIIISKEMFKHLNNTMDNFHGSI